MEPTSQPAPAGAKNVQIETAISSFTSVLENLQASHARLEQRAQHMEAELYRANEELEAKVTELDRVKQHLESVLTSIPAGVIVYDTEARVVRANDAALQILGVQRTELLGVGCVAGLAGAAADGEPTEVRCADGAVRVLARRYSPVVLASGALAGAVEVIEDQSELVRAQERLHRLDKTAALGTMAGGIAHEIRNPLHAIQGFAQLLLREAEGDSRATRHAARIQEGVNEIESIVASMLGIAGEGELRIESFNVRAMIREAVEAVIDERDVPSLWNIELVGPATTLTADRIKVRQAIRNLVANACDAQPTGGAVRVETTSIAGAAGDAVTVTVSDNGPGIPPHDVERLCDPFFTTRAEGTGMGLALVQRVAELHGGLLELTTQPESAVQMVGARFALTIPAQRKESDPDAASHSGATDPDGTSS